MPLEMTKPSRLAWLLAVTVATAGLAQTPAPRAGHAMTTAGADGIYLVGGQIIDTTPRLVDTLWRWSGNRWRPLATDGPHNRSLPAAAFDSRRQVLVVYRGTGLASGTRYGDTWEWNGQRWEERNLKTPGNRDHHAMAYDEARGKLVMFGGARSATDPYPNDTWTYDGSRWERADTSTGPPAGLVHHAMAYDARRQRVVMFGGFDFAHARSADVWEWDGHAWQRITPSGPAPAPRSHLRMAYDVAHGVTVVFGGDQTGETWTWDGSAWRSYPPSGPSARWSAAMAYDARRQRVILFGGSGRGGVPPFNYLNDCWEWDGEKWVRAGA